MARNMHKKSEQYGDSLSRAHHQSAQHWLDHCMADTVQYIANDRQRGQLAGGGAAAVFVFPKKSKQLLLLNYFIK